MGAGAGVGVCGAVGGWLGVSCWLAVVAAGGPLLAGVETGVLGEVGAAGFVVLPALYMGVLCLYWPGKADVELAPAVADSSGWRADCSASRPEPPAFALNKLKRALKQCLERRSFFFSSSQ